MPQIEEIVRLDQVLMESILDNYDPSRRRQGLRREISEGAQIIVDRDEKNELRSYIEFIEKEKAQIYVVSMQSVNRFISRSFIRKIHDFLILHKSKMLTSSVHKNNAKSIHLHKKLGFTARETKDRFLFQIEAHSLDLRLQKLRG